MLLWPAGRPGRMVGAESGRRRCWVVGPWRGVPGNQGWPLGPPLEQGGAAVASGDEKAGAGGFIRVHTYPYDGQAKEEFWG